MSLEIKMKELKGAHRRPCDRGISCFLSDSLIAGPIAGPYYVCAEGSPKGYSIILAGCITYGHAVFVSLKRLPYKSRKLFEQHLRGSAFQLHSGFRFSFSLTLIFFFLA